MKVAIELFHGRRHPEERLDNWGSQGPVFLVDYVHVTYAGDFKLGLPEPAGDGDLHYVERPALLRRDLLRRLVGVPRRTAQKKPGPQSPPRSLRSRPGRTPCNHRPRATRSFQGGIAMTFVVHRGGWEATKADLAAVPVPEPTPSYHPVPYGRFIEEVELHVPRFGLEIRSAQFALAREGAQMFGVLTCMQRRSRP